MAIHDLHIGDFCADTAQIFLLLYRRFPTKSALYIDDICGPDTPDEFGLHSPRYLACFNTAVWLAEEGFYRFSQTVLQEALEDVVLTQKGFLFLSLLNSAPDTLNSRIKELEALMQEKNSARLNNYVLDQLNLF